MKLVTFRHGASDGIGCVDLDKDLIWRLDNGTLHRFGIRTMLDLIGCPELTPGGIERGNRSLPMSDVTLLAPIPRPARNIFCVGKHYFDHAHEFSKSGFDGSAPANGEAVPDAPIIFTKTPETVIGPNAPMLFPMGVSECIDYGAELAVVIGKPGRQISRDDALDHVWGYTIINDVTARDWQQRHKQWFLGKSFDTFCPMGPWIVTADEMDYRGNRVRCWVNDELRQNASTDDLILTCQP